MRVLLTLVFVLVGFTAGYLASAYKRLVYVGFPEYPWCQKCINYLDEIAREENLDKIYYHLDKDQNGNPRIFDSGMVAVQDSKIIGHNNTFSPNSSKDGMPDEWWIEELVNVLKDQLHTIVKAVKSCEAVCSE